MIFSHQIMVAYVASVLKKTTEEEESGANEPTRDWNRALDPGTRVERVNS